MQIDFLPKHFSIKYSQRKEIYSSNKLRKNLVRDLVQLYRAETKTVSRLKFKHMNSDLNRLNCTTALSINDLN